MKVPLKENDFLDWNENENLNLDIKVIGRKKILRMQFFLQKNI